MDDGQHPNKQYPQQQQQNQQQQQQNANLVLELNANDVLCGRGVPVIINQGNVRFRELVRSRKQEYLSNWRHQIKHSIALKIYAEVQRRQGRFLRLIESTEDKERLGLAAGIKAWEIISEEDAVEKIKQALRGKDGNRTPVMTVSAASEPPLGYSQQPPPLPQPQNHAQLSMLLPTANASAGPPPAAVTTTATSPSFDVYTLQILIGLQQQQQQAMRQAAQMPVGLDFAAAPMAALSNLSHHSPSGATSTRPSNQLDILLGRAALPAGASRENWQGSVGNVPSHWPGAVDARTLNHSNTNTNSSSWSTQSFASFETAATMASTLPRSAAAPMSLSPPPPPPVQQSAAATAAATAATPSIHLRPSVGRPLAPPPPPSPTRIVPPVQAAAVSAMSLAHEDVELDGKNAPAPVNHVHWTNSNNSNGNSRTSTSAATTASNASTLSNILDLMSTSSATSSGSSDHSHAVLSNAATTTTSARLLELLPYIQEAAAAVAHEDRQSRRLESSSMNPGRTSAVDVGRTEFVGARIPPIPTSVPPATVLERLAQCVQAVDSLGDDEVHRLLAGYLREQAPSSPQELALADRVSGALLPQLPPLPTNDHLYLPNQHHHRDIHNEPEEAAGATAAQPRLLPRLPPQRRASTIAAAAATAAASLVGPSQPLQQLSPLTTSRTSLEENTTTSSLSLLRASSPTSTARMPSREANGSISDDHHPYSPRLNLLVEAALEHVTDSATRTSSVSELASVDSTTAVLPTVRAHSTTMTMTRPRMESDSPSIENGDSSQPSASANSTTSNKRQRR